MGMSITFTDNFSRFERHLDDLQGVLEKYALEVESGAKEAVQTGPKTGNQYGEHQASAPGQAPATDLGNLVNSIKAVPQDKYTWIIAATAEYAQALELGTRFIEPRPFLIPALMAVEKDFKAAVQALLKD